jgi:dihydroorotase
MKSEFDLLIRNGTCLLPWGEFQTDIGVSNGRISSIGVSADTSAPETFDARGLHVLPGLIDAHVHFRDPGDSTVETLPTGSKAAVLGGLTTVFDMPNTAPPIVDRQTSDWKRDFIDESSWCDMGFYLGATRNNIDELPGLEQQEGVCAIKCFMGGAPSEVLLLEDDETLERMMRSGRRRVCFHSEDEYRVRDRKKMFKIGDPYSSHMEWRDVEAAFLGTRRLVAIAERTGRPMHVLHVSTADELRYVKDHRDLVTVELLVNHLTQVAPDCYDRLQGFGVMNPPIRGQAHQDAMWAAIADGTVDVVGSDHAPYSREAKTKPWPACSSGLTGVQTIVPIMLNHVNSGRLTLARLADVMSAGPTRVYGLLSKGRITTGYDADFTIVDMKKKRTIEESWIVSPCGWTPFDGTEVTGWPIATIIRGMIVMRDDEVQGPPRGRHAKFH